MSKIQDKHIAKKFKMPFYKIMGTIPDNTSKDIKRLIQTNDMSLMPNISKTIAGILKSEVSNLSADQYDESLDERGVVRPILDTTSIFYINVSPIVVPEINNLLGNSYNLRKNAVVFINDRDPHYLTQPNNMKTMLMRGTFVWDVNIHAD
ncbi:hypothetical protein N9I00_01265 [bacterium]|nr:hypothetical protein [bacterium]